MANPLFNAAEGRLRAGLRIALFLLLYALGSAVLIAGTGAALAGGFLGYSQGFLVVGCAWLCARNLDRRPLADFGLRMSPAWWLDALLGLGLGLLLASFCFLSALGLGWAEIRSAPGTGFGGAMAARALLAFLSLSLQDEVMYRGYFLKNLAEGLGFPRIRGKGAGIAALVASALLYALFHLNYPGMGPLPFLNLFLLGLMLGLPLLLGGQLALSLGLRLGWTFCGGAVFGFSIAGREVGSSAIDIAQGGPSILSGATFGPEAGLLGTAAFLLGGAAILGIYRLKAGGWLNLRADWGRPGSRLG